MKKSKKIVLIALVCSLLLNTQVQAQDTMPIDSIQNTQAQTINDSVPVMVKATVPDGFESNVTVQYVGKNTDGFTVTLTKDDQYESLITIQRDKYVYKQSSIADGYGIKVVDTFSVQNAADGQTYYLPINVSVGEVVNDQIATLLFTANFDAIKEDEYEEEESESEDAGEDKENEDDKNNIPYEGNITLSYSGTEGNSLSITLNKENGYTSEVQVKKDIYTLQGSYVENGYECDSLYSFSLVNALADTVYEMIVEVLPEGTMALRQEEELEIWEEENTITVQDVPEQKKLIMFELDIPSYMRDTFDTDVYISYKTESGEECDIVLSRENNFQSMKQIPYGIYQCVYAISYDSQEYQFSSQDTLAIVDETPDGTFVNVKIMKDGEILTDEEAVASEEKGTSYVLLLIIAVIAIGVIVYILYKKKKDMPINEDDTDIDMEDEDDIE